MDIPNSGAIFTLGKSHLAENTQSYFYIKNDPIKRLIAGPYQSAVICESGRLFVWGENQHGQLGIGGQQLTNINNNNRTEDIIIKPTCVKSLKSLGLKVADMSFGNDWSIILTLSNELFFTGRNIFSRDCTVSTNFTEATINGELSEIIRKPFRLEDFDNYLSNNEENENFVNVLAGNEHFVVLTSFGRLIGWGSNQSYQLGSSNEDEILKPHEIVLDSSIQQYTCGPESTLILTENGKLYLTGRLNELVFPYFTELQKNLSSNEQIIFMNISKASEIFIVTNTGSIYRSYESARNKSLIFQRFYDYDSEENGALWKLLKGTSFYAALTKSSKFYTTFSESGHHLKTFIEISKFKNLRILDIALGDMHILVHGIPRLSTLAATVGPAYEYRYVTQGTIMANTTNGILNRTKSGKAMILDRTLANIENATIKPNSPVHVKNENGGATGMEEVRENDSTFPTIPNNSLLNRNEIQNQVLDVTHNGSIKVSEKSIESFESENTVVKQKSPILPLKSQTSSINSIKKEVNNIKLDIDSLRSKTPFPENSPRSSSQSTMKRTPMRNLSYEAAITNDFLNHKSPPLEESLEELPELVTKKNDFPDLNASLSTPYTEDDDELRLEISETTDPLDNSVTVNEIRFINNGIDVTSNVKKLKSNGSEESLDASSEEEDNEKDYKLLVKKQAENFIEELENEIEKRVETVETSKKEEENVFETKRFSDKNTSTPTQSKDSINYTLKGIEGSIDATFSKAAIKADTEVPEAVQNVSDNKRKATTGTKEEMENMSGSISSASEEARQTVIHLSNNIPKATGETKQNINNALSKITGDTKIMVGSVTSKISNEVQGAKNSFSSMLQGKKNKVDIQIPTELMELDDDFRSEATSKESGGSKSNNTTTTAQDDDERTTASANSNHTVSAGNPFDNIDAFDPELDAMVQRGKQALRDELQATSVAAENKTEHIINEVTQEKSRFSKFFDGIREKSKGLSCRNEKSIKVLEDQPPSYNAQDELAVHPVTNGSKVCVIL